MSDADRLEQLLIEEKLSTAEVEQYIIKDLLSLEEHIIPLFKGVVEYLNNDSFFEGKHFRVQAITVPAAQIVEKVLIACLSSREPQTIQSVVGKVVPMFPYENTRHSLSTAAELIALCSRTGLYSFISPGELGNESGMVKANVALEEATYQRIQEAMYLPPMICEPMLVESNKGNGYLLGENKSVLLNNTHHDMPIGLDVINKTAAMQFTVDEEAIKSTEPMPDFKAKALKDGREITELQLVEAKKNFMQQRSITEHIEKSLVGKPFHFNSAYDSRGRFYTSGYHIAMQSTDYKKSVISLYNKENITDEGMYWLKIDIANLFGLDKALWEERLEWVEENYEELEDLVEGADEPFMYAKAVRALRDAEKGCPIGHMVAQDATASFLEVFAVLSGCEKTAEQCNLSNTGRREDFYANLPLAMQGYLGGALNLTRKRVKSAAMPHFYGSSSKPKQVFGSETPQLDAFYEALNDLVPGAETVASVIENCWDSVALHHTWVLPDGHTAHKPVMVTSIYEGIKAPDEGLPYTFTYMCKENAPSDYSIPIKADVIQSFDAYLVREVIRRCDFEVLTIHDSYHCHANNMSTLREHYRDILIELAEAPTLGDLVESLTGSRPSWGDMTASNLVEGLKEAEYFLS